MELKGRTPPPATPSPAQDDTRVEREVRPLVAIEELTQLDSDHVLPVPSGSGATLEAKTSLSTLAIGDVIGEGGMGVVREAIQLSLARVVAVKETLPGANEADAARMLREAWVTGFLEHPGVVPIYDIAKGRAGPAVLMRRIEGETWHTCLADEEWAAIRGARDLLEQNLNVFVRVCEILEFAHAKGVMHRDIKPSNVMIGAFGEVYLLDWGLALALHGEAERHLPTSAETREVGGTMSYAAPEMVGLIDAPMNERTDIYLLGALLFELSTGNRPHTRASEGEMIASIDTSPPAIPDAVSPGLAGPILRRAR
jgi:eukaryotic-like serine/threonine-protein kinase